MEQQRIQELLERFAQARVLVVGDVYLDEMIYGAMTGVSLEAPVPVYEVQARSYNPGAAGNAACNVAALGAKTHMVGVIGGDINADIVRQEFAARNVDVTGLVVDARRPTNTYGKLRAGGFNIPTQEILRTDTPSPAVIEADLEEQVITNIERLALEADAIMVVDQVASVVTERVLDAVLRCAKKHELLTVGDSRSRIGDFRGFDVVVPNDREAGAGAGIEVVDDPSLDKACRALLGIARNAVVTRGADGITVFAENGRRQDFPIQPRQVVDVTGAGDTVTAAVTVTLVAGGIIEEAAIIANAAAGVAVMKIGAVTVSREELERALAESNAPDKLRSVEELTQIIQELQRSGKRVVWTNGCFDILHVGHVTYLLKAAQLGDALVVGLNSDVSVRAVKGPNRPIVNEADRALVISALECVNFVTIFSDPTTVDLLRTLKPDVYAKGGDYSVETINQEERRLVEGYGGSIAIIPGIVGQSTTAIIERILDEGAGGGR